jgi:hypothetical protein
VHRQAGVVGETSGWRRGSVSRLRHAVGWAGSDSGPASEFPIPATAQAVSHGAGLGMTAFIIIPIDEIEPCSIQPRV